MRVFDEICGSLDSNKAVFMALLDLSAAFDTVDHQILQRRLEALLGVRESALNWFVVISLREDYASSGEWCQIRNNAFRLLCASGIKAWAPSLFGLYYATGCAASDTFAFMRMTRNCLRLYPCYVSNN